MILSFNVVSQRYPLVLSAVRTCFTYSLFLFIAVLYASSAIYFAGVMVRLMLTLTPIVCVFAAIAISHTLENYLVEETIPDKTEKSSSAASGSSAPVKVSHTYTCAASPSIST